MKPHLFSPLKLRGVLLRNRIGVSPMCMHSSAEGKANDWHLVHLGSRAIGGAGLILLEDTAVEPRGRIAIQDAGLWSEDQIEPLLRITGFLRKHGAASGIQLGHAGRRGSTPLPWDREQAKSFFTKEEGGWELVAPSAIPFSRDAPFPRELSRSEILELQEAFRRAAVRAREAGFDLLELHAAHGFLIHSFYSPLSNQRTDEYGGSFENRIRFLMETLRKVRSVWKEENPVAVRLSCTDWAEGGWTLEDSIDLVKRLKEEGVDLIDCSSGGLLPGVDHPKGPSWQVPLSRAVRNGAQIATAAVGDITDPKQADEIIRSGDADLVFLAREMLRDPYWPYHAAIALNQKTAVRLPLPYDYAV